MRACVCVCVSMSVRVCTCAGVHAWESEEKGEITGALFIRLCIVELSD